jgi:hypothetical protein
MDGSTAPSLTVARLRVRAPAADRDAGLAATRALEAADVHPRSLPPASILIVRSLEDPLPGALELPAAGAPPPVWQTAVASELDLLVHAAARPGLAPVPATARAVLFADRAELIACLAADWLSGELARRWWWKFVAVAGRSTGTRLVEALASEPRYVPATFELLARRGLAVEVARALEPAAAERIAGEVARAFGVERVHEEVVRATRAAARPAPASEPEAAPALLVDRIPGLPQEAGSPWVDLVPEAEPAAALDPAQRWLVVLALALRRRPAALRTEGFALPAAAAPAARPGSARAPIGDSVPGPPRREPPAEGASIDEIRATLPAAGLGVPRPGPSGRPAVRFLPRDGEERTAGAREPAADDQHAAGDRESLSPPVAPASTSAVGAEPVGGAASPRRSSALSDALTSATRHPPPVTAPRAVPDATQASSRNRPSAERSAIRAEGAQAEPFALPLPPPVRTRLGGLFYLVAVAQSLGLYGDFTTPREPGIALYVWDFVALVGAELLPEPFPDDPVWTLLASLAGRGPHDPPGAGFDPPEDWCPPPGRHERYAAALSPSSRNGKPSSRHGTPLERWTRNVAGYVQARLALALDRPPGDVPGIVLLRHAEVHVSAAHVDVVFALADLPLEIRLAGIDRTPGWIPAAGRHLSIHFR